ncbi:hypothetical protein ABHF54_10455 [Nitrosomonas europaea]|uniref:hypothetical protein n=1 Tax=Nitrosomonas europaea TaxID=915 RepID=UPI003266491B
MAISASFSKPHWNYFIALENDLEKVARYIEFAESNFNVYSIELAHLLFASASEIDAVAKLLCKQFDPNAPRTNICEYRATLLKALPNLPSEEVFVPRFGLTIKPWLNWGNGKSPVWWRAYNHVKHKRDTHFSEATLKNALESLGALLVLSYYYYAYKLSPDQKSPLDSMQTTNELQPASTLLRLSDDHYYGQVLTGEQKW